MNTAQSAFGVIPMVIGVGLIYWINRRKFNRRNVAGLEGFSSFEKSVFVRFIERIGKWIAYALILIGILSIWANSQIKKDKEKQQQKVKTERSR
jgi:hypothetical protein